MIYGAFRTYNNHQDKVSPSTYLGISIGVSAAQNLWTLFVPAAASPNVAGIGVGLGLMAAASVYQGVILYSAMAAGEEIGMVARQPNFDAEIGVVARQPKCDDKEIIRNMLGEKPIYENRELR